MRKNKKERQKEGLEGEGGATMCRNILLPSKVAKEWRNIPFNVYKINFFELKPNTVTLVFEIKKSDLPHNVVKA